jgi:LacI family transcriptional regulator
MAQKRLVLFLDMAIRTSQDLVKGVVNYFKSRDDWTLHIEPGFSSKELHKLDITETFSGISALLVQSLYSPEMEDFIKKLKIPVITAMDKKVPGCINILADEQNIAEMAHKTLTESGFENLAFYGYTNQIFSINRRKHFTELLKSNGKEVLQYHDDYYEHLFTWAWDTEKLSNWLKSLPKPVGIMCCCDHTAFRLVNTCKETGIRIPEQISVLSVGDNELICSLNNPEISSITMDFEHAGYLAAQSLNSVFEKGSFKPDVILAESKYVTKRHSTDILITPNDEVTKAIRYIHNNIDNLTGVSDVVKVTGLSRRHLERRFKEIFNRTIYEEIRRVRVQQIAKLLLDTNLTVSEISYTLGYMGDSHIRRYFKAETGLTPLEYRKKSRK